MKNKLGNPAQIEEEKLEIGRVGSKKPNKLKLLRKKTLRTELDLINLKSVYTSDELADSQSDKSVSMQSNQLNKEL